MQEFWALRNVQSSAVCAALFGQSAAACCWQAALLLLTAKLIYAKVRGGDSVGRIEWTSMHFSHELRLRCLAVA
mgnify:CR=1 FL=1